MSRPRGSSERCAAARELDIAVIEHATQPTVSRTLLCDLEKRSDPLRRYLLVEPTHGVMHTALQLLHTVASAASNRDEQ